MRRARSGLPALSLWNPHAGLMACGAKSVETRGVRFAVNGPLAIAATIAVPAEHRMWARNLCLREPFRSTLRRQGWESFDAMPRGCIVALVWVDGETRIGPLLRETIRRTYGNAEIEFGLYEEGRFALTTDRERLIRLPTPVTAKGKQGKWFVDRAARDAIRAQLADVPLFALYRDAFDRADAGEVGPPVPTAYPPDPLTPTSRT